MATQGVRPVMQALLLADKVYEDKSGKKVICGTFNRIARREVQPPPSVGPQLILAGAHPGSPTAYVSLTDVVDGTALTLQFVNVSKNKVVFGLSFKISNANRLATIELTLPMPDLSDENLVPVGHYSLDLVWNDEILGSHRIIVEKIP